MAEEVNPFVGPRPLSSKEPIFGRSREIRELLHLFTAERIVLLYSPSGAGKSSLINAKDGLLDRMRVRFDVRDPIRVNTPPLWNAGLAETLKVPAGDKPIVLIFDQFEEILRLDPANLDAKRDFFREVGELLRDPSIWALFVLREDYLAPLDSYAPLIPTALKNRFRIDLLKTEAAKIDIQKIAAFTPDAAAKVIDNLAMIKAQKLDGTFAEQTGAYVEPVQVQVSCRALWERLPHDNKTIDLDAVEKYGRVSDSLSSYYADEVEKASGKDEKRERAIRDWFESSLLTPEGMRRQVLRSSQEVGDPTIDALERSHLLRGELRGGSSWWIELSHDRLVAPILKDNREWLAAHLNPTQIQAALWDRQGRHESLLAVGRALSDAEAWSESDAAALEDFEREFIAESQRNRKRLERDRRRTVVLWFVTAAALLLMGASFYLYLRAESSLDRAFLFGLRASRDGLSNQDGNELPARALLGVEVSRLEDTPENSIVLRDAVANLPRFKRRFALDGPLADLAISGNGRHLVLAYVSGSVVSVDMETRAARTVFKHSVAPLKLLAAGEARVLLVSAEDALLLDVEKAENVGGGPLTALASAAVPKVQSAREGETLFFVQRTGSGPLALEFKLAEDRRQWAPGTRFEFGPMDEGHHPLVGVNPQGEEFAFTLAAGLGTRIRVKGLNGEESSGLSGTTAMTGLGEPVTAMAWAPGLSQTLAVGTKHGLIAVTLSAGRKAAKELTKAVRVRGPVDELLWLDERTVLAVSKPVDGHAYQIDIVRYGDQDNWYVLPDPMDGNIATHRLRLHPAGKLAALALEKSVGVYELPNPPFSSNDKAALVAEICSRLEANLSEAEWRKYAGDRAYSKTCPGK